LIVLEGCGVKWFWYVTVLALSWIDLDKPEGFSGCWIMWSWRFGACKDLVLETIISFVSSAFACFLPLFQFCDTLIAILIFLYIPLPFLLSTLPPSLHSSFTCKAVTVSTNEKVCVIIVQDVKLCACVFEWYVKAVFWYVRLHKVKILGNSSNMWRLHSWRN